MEFRVLGPVEIVGDGKRGALPGRLQRILVGVLLARANRPVPADTLTDALWGDRPDPRAAQKLQLHVHRLRTALGEPDRLTHGPDGYRLRVQPGEVDADRFESMAAEAREATDAQHAVRTLRRALELWRGDPFDDLDVPVLADWARRLAEHRLLALEALYEAELACGMDAAVVAELSDLVRRYPLRERLHAQLMTALYRSGRRADALAAYQAAREALVAELGLEPGPELRDLQRRILDSDAPSPAAAAPAQLPADTRGFVGREPELRELDTLMAGDGPALAVVAGTGGVGKTSLAIRWAHSARARFPGGQLYVDLRGYGPDQPRTPEDVLAGFLRALGVEGSAIPSDPAERSARFRTLADGRRMLVVLDNARDVAQVRPLLPGSATCAVLVTSRDALAGLVAREGAHRVDLARLPEADARALLRVLLGDRVDAEPDALEALVARCARLPLALRVAAELVRSRPELGVTELAAELADQQDALDLLDLDGDRHTAVRSVFSWSYQRLDPWTALVFRLLGRHPGWDTDAHAVAAMAAAPVRRTRRALDALCRAHLVDQLPGARYRAHDLLRAYAAELTDPSDDPLAADRLRDHYLGAAAAAMDVLAPHETERRPKVSTPDSELPPFTDAFRWLDTELPNLLAVVRQDPSVAPRMSGTLWRFLDIAGYHDDALTLHTSALEAARAVEDPQAEADALRVLGAVTFRLGDHPTALDHLEGALTAYERIGNHSLRAATLNNLGAVHGSRGDRAESKRCYQEALALYERTGQDALRPPVLNNLARTLLALGSPEEATAHFEQALAAVADGGDPTSEASALCGLAEVCLATDRAADAPDYARRALDVARQSGHRTLEGTALRALGVAHLRLGDPDQATHHLESARAAAREAGDSELLASVHTALAEVTETGHPTPHPPVSP
ncbi:AfsR/SARP family transcriptional regulator [Actinophytocola gossypii]|uniref:Tetratricopeptide repeat protein n=1 Tax=Actinophytocola gossypii TaxID=2812003 RepID=A0ABT2J4X1_9PSEU|nr:AfsR/SARP family transcriptional regulator [Actinophytocola gossypii]MCT2582908.1 tetratricopeptide repeat protein [Actinophytocola gossypii]